MAEAKKRTPKSEAEKKVIQSSQDEEFELPKEEEKSRAEPTPSQVDKNISAEDAPVQLDEEGKAESEPAMPESPDSPTFYDSPYGRRVVQKAVLYTDGISGTADLNHERAYEYSEKLQSNDPSEREAGDQSLSEAAQDAKSDGERREADRAKQGNRQ